ncbi:MAG TPA: transglycosylase SLT domain-containing protein [Caulobacteraceae bacterium]|nr:transglycosylase SLT domain-containing protein [Caulobacteraceae bacterium]
MPVESIREAVSSAIERASKATGVDFSFLLRTARRESGYNTGAKAQSSTAAGLFQFVDQTWLATLKRHGAKYGYARYADLIQQAPDGRFEVKGEEARRTVMDLKLDPKASALMAGELTTDHASYLRGRMGREPTDGELYAAHFLGPKASAQLIEAYQSRPRASAAGIFPDAAQANPTIFYREGRPLSVAEVYSNLTRGGDTAVAISAPAAAPIPTAPVDPGAFVQYAMARRLEKVEQEHDLADMVLRGPESPNEGASGLANAMFSSEMLRVLSEANQGRSRS